MLRAHLVPTAQAFAGKTVFAFAGIGRPEKFVASLQDGGAHVTGSCFFADHHPYTDDEIAQLKAIAGDAMLVTTEKDFVRLTTGAARGHPPCWRSPPPFDNQPRWSVCLTASRPGPSPKMP